jgi:hypothetical protein
MFSFNIGWSYMRLPKSPTTTHSPWRWQLQCLPKCWMTLNNRRGSSPKVEVIHCYYCCRLMWSCSHIKERALMKDVWEQGAQENICMKEGGIKSGLEKTK